MTTTNTPTPTVAEPALAKGLNKRNARESVAAAKATKKPTTKKSPASKKAAPAKKPAAAKAANTFTTVELAAEKGVNPKTLRARIRRNIDDWTPLFKNGEKHVFADNKTTRAKIDALL